MPQFMEETKTTIKRYSHGLFWVDVWEELKNGEPFFWAAIQKKDCSIRADLFGTPVYQKDTNETLSWDEFLEIVERNLPEREASYCKRMNEKFGNYICE